MEKTSNKTIAKNTLFLYFRMALVTVVGLYTSRVVLKTLGVEDYGIYNVAASVVALFGFLTGALGGSSSRYITVEIGKVKDNDIRSLVKCFETTRSILLILAAVVLIAGETIGLLVLNNSSIPPDRMQAALWVFQLSILTAIVGILQLPYNALIIAHERMSIYAYLSIFEVFAKLGICYLLIISPIDSLVFYALLLAIIKIILFLFYRTYCKKQFDECSFKYSVSKSFFKPILSFSFWNLFGALSTTALTQGSTIIISFFFGPVIVAARAVANQVKLHVTDFVSNFRMAINPQILKRHSAGDMRSSRELLLRSTNITFYLMLLLVLPLFLEARPILGIWLEEVPQYTTEFLKIALVEMLFYVYDVSFYQIFQAEGRLKENAMLCPLSDLVGFGIVYLIYYFGGSVFVIAWAMLVLTIIQGMIIKPMLAIKLFKYKFSDFWDVFINNIKVLLISVVLPLVVYSILPSSLFSGIFVIFISITSVLLTSYFIGLNKADRTFIANMIRTRIHINK